MNTLLHFADATMQYYRGKQTGLWGLVGIALAIVIATAWDYILPIFEASGIVSLLNKTGLIYEGSPSMTAFRIFVAFILFYICLIIVGFVLLAVFSIVMMVSQSKIGQGLLIIAFFLIFFPFVALYGIVRLLAFMGDKKEQKQNPEAYAERKRLKKNKKVIDYLITAGVEEEKIKILRQREKECEKLYEKFQYDKAKEIMNAPLGVKEDNIISFEDAKNRLNRLPTMGDYFFLLGVTYERDIYLLVPRPQLPYQNDKFIGEKWLLKGEINYQSKEREFYLDLNNSPFDRDREYPKVDKINYFDHTKHTFKEIPFDEFELFIDPARCGFDRDFRAYLQFAHFQYYVEHELDLYFLQKRNLKNKINNAQTKEEFDSLVNEIKLFNIGNEDVVSRIWEQNSKYA
ncbi:hypothetical protein DZB84_20530 [Bacillus sp. HNG]|uniref:hypothetical protein n=1 Tax=Bacillus sp. HNG TaxID=2293325 RepID=UPI000E2F5BFC|nr:hypothetical protein [Bacillus sp. HNG]RFB11456.1 hypothetical protein DZB84_20530 [Bacillus sp. HNG]